MAIFFFVADEGCKSEFCFSGIKKLILNLSFISRFGSSRFKFGGAEDGFHCHQSAVGLWASDFNIE